jgi:MFS family permease
MARAQQARRISDKDLPTTLLGHLYTNRHPPPLGVCVASRTHWARRFANRAALIRSGIPPSRVTPPASSGTGGAALGGTVPLVSDLTRSSGGPPSRRGREQRAYRLAVTGGVAGAVAVIGAILAAVGVFGWGVPVLAAIIAVVCLLLFRRTVAP